MIIGIDGNEANIKEKVGVHQYSYELLHSFYRIAKHRNDLAFIIYLKNIPRDDLPPQTNNWKYKIILGKGMWILKNLMPDLLLHPDIDVFFTPSHYLPLFTRVPQVCTIHDLGYLEYSEQFRKFDFWQLKYWTATSINVSKHIIAVSEFTKKDIVRQYHFASNKITVVHHGLDKGKYNNHISPSVVRQLKDKYKISKNYILFLSTLKPSKNIEGLIDAFDDLSGKYPDYQLVISGKKGWLYDSLFLKAEKLIDKDKIIFTDFVSEEDKPALLSGAKVFVSPSFYEGFGMHVLEAMACGIPVVVSNAASFPEIVKDAGIIVDPESINSIKEGIEKTINLSEIEYNKLSEKACNRAKTFSWEKCGNESLEVLTGVGTNK